MVIALACRKLPPAQRTQGILWGTAGAIVLRVVLILFAMTLLNLPFFKLAGALLPARARRRRPQQRAGQRPVADRIKTIIVADLVMSVDNVIAIAGAAQHSGEQARCWWCSIC